MNAEFEIRIKAPRGAGKSTVIASIKRSLNKQYNKVEYMQHETGNEEILIAKCRFKHEGPG